jgi:hypothetical protein
VHAWDQEAILPEGAWLGSRRCTPGIKRKVRAKSSVLEVLL